MANRPAPHAHPVARNLILRAWHVDPLRSLVCESPMGAIGCIDDPRMVEKILRHRGAWHDPPARPPPGGTSGPYPTNLVTMWIPRPTMRMC